MSLTALEMRRVICSHRVWKDRVFNADMVSQTISYFAVSLLSTQHYKNLVRTSSNSIQFTKKLFSS